VKKRGGRIAMRKAVLGTAVLAAAALLAAAGCAGLAPRGSAGSAPTSEVERIDTYVQDTETISGGRRRSAPVAPPEEPAPVLSAVPDDATPAPPPPPQKTASIDIRHESGYRVQLYATREAEKAKAFAESARRSFKEKIYVEYLDPYYKVRVGDCLTREEARLLLDRAKAAGFDQAWITSTLVIRTTENDR
jgi:cell division septation protein DedD